MHRSSLAISQLQSLLGPNSNDDAIWSDLCRFETAALPLINATWEIDTSTNNSYWYLIHQRDDASRALHEQRCAATVERLTSVLGVQTASRCAASFLLHPQLWQARYTGNQHHAYNSPGHLQQHLLTTIATACVSRQPPVDWIARIAQRIVTLCSAASTADAPDLARCVTYLLAYETPRVAPLLDALTVGNWQAGWNSVVALSGYAVPSAVERLRVLWGERGAQHAKALLLRAARLKRLNADVFRRIVETLPNSLYTINKSLEQHIIAPSADPSEAAYLTEIQRLADEVIWEMVCDFRPESRPALGRIQFLCGGRYLLRLAEEIEQRGIVQLKGNAYNYERIDSLFISLLGALQQRPDDDSDALVALLRQLQVATLLAVLPHAPAYQREICAALDWPGSGALVELLHRLEAQAPARSSDPSAGVVHREEVQNCVGRMEEQQLRMLLDAFAMHRSAAVTLVRAVLGWNRSEVRRLLGRRNQLAARALALLPLQKPEELLQRYLLLTRYQREANSSGAGRKAYERAAAQAGLANLALHAGYADATRLEWAMEDQLGAQEIRLGRTWEIEGYMLTLELRDGELALVINNGKRNLKRTPSLVVRDYAYREVCATLEAAQDQERRYRQAFLDAMRRDQPLTPEEIALLRRNPLATNLLERLVLIDAAGSCGLFRADDCSLEGLYGERVRITGSLCIAHPYALSHIGILNDWQTEIIKQQIVQPFKQVFRELYVLTPAERDAGYASARLAGRRMKGRQATAVLANLGWLNDGYGTVRKPLYEHGYAAHFETGDYSYGYDEDDNATTGILSFWPLKETNGSGERRIPLADVPPLVFSEVLRDLDLVTVIAHQSEEEGTSREVIERRADLVRATVAALGLAQVRVEEPYVHVRGSVTSYRIHLATGAIYLASGQYLCIVPHPRERKAIYLPFADGGEPISSEIMSKVLLLANDAAITDGTILAQILPTVSARHLV